MHCDSQLRFCAETMVSRNLETNINYISSIIGKLFIYRNNSIGAYINLKI